MKDEDEEEDHQDGVRDVRVRVDVVLDRHEGDGDDETPDAVADRRDGHRCGAMLLREDLRDDDRRQRTETDGEQDVEADDAHGTDDGRPQMVRVRQRDDEQDEDRNHGGGRDEKERTAIDPVEELERHDGDQYAGCRQADDGVGGVGL